MIPEQDHLKARLQAKFLAIFLFLAASLVITSLT